MARFCGNCGGKLNDGDQVCGNCGTPTGQPVVGQRERQTAIIKKRKPYKAMLLACLVVGVGIASAAAVIVASNFRKKDKANLNIESSVEGDLIENMSKTEEPDTSNSFVMDHEPREGFMQAGQSLSEVSSGYIGIYTADDMQKLSQKTSGKFILMADLDLSGIQWDSVEFGGSFDGNYHSISGMQTCLFAKLKGDVENLGLEDTDIKQGAALVGEMENGTIENCYVTGKVKGNAAMVSRINPLSDSSIFIQRCYNTADVIYDTYSTSVGIGGIIGTVDLGQYFTGSVQIYIANCENYGNIETKSLTGGIVGNVFRESMSSEVRCSLFKCFNYGDVFGEECVGGIEGRISASNGNSDLKESYEISQCANYGEVSGRENVGGICGEVWTEANQGYNFVVEVGIEDCLNAGKVCLASDTSDEVLESGGICGQIRCNNGTCKIRRCLNIGNKKSEYYSRPSINLSDPVYECQDYYSLNQMSIAQMKDMKTNLKSFDYPNVWGINGLYRGFPHPYSDDEREDVFAYSDARNEKDVEDTLANSSEDDIILMQRYADMLASISMGGYWPDDEKRENQLQYLTEWSDGEDNYFAIVDVDSDGTEELVVKTAYNEIFAFNYDLEQGKVKKRTLESSYLEGSDELEWMALRATNYAVYTQAYIKYILKAMEQDLDVEQDIGVLYMKSNDGLERVKNMLESKHNIDFIEVEEGIYSEGDYKGEDAFLINYEDGGGFTYLNQQLDGLTLFGLYPGMTGQEAESKLIKYGFTEKSDNSYATGDNTGNYFVYIMTDNSVVTQISVYQGGLYVG